MDDNNNNKIENRKIFLIDMENVNSSGLDGYDLLKKNDEIHIFIGKCDDKLKTHFLSTCQKKKIKIFYHDISLSGKNSLDFQITSCLGSLAALKRHSDFYIVSCDKGFDSSILFLQDFYQKRQIIFARIECIGFFNHDYVPEEKKEITGQKERDRKAKDIIRNKLKFMEDSSEAERDVFINIVYKACRKEEGSLYKKNIKEHLHKSFGQKGDTLYTLNKNYLSSIQQDVNSIFTCLSLKQPSEKKAQ